jgi:transglutaminase-like putative cysteine protease
MSFARLHKLVTYALAGLGLVSLSLGGELSALAIVIVAVLAIASWWAESPRIDDPRWGIGWNVALVALFVMQILRGLLGEPPLPLALEATALLQVSRLSYRRSATEYQQIAILAFLHLCAATVLSTELTYGVLFFGFVVLAPWMLALTHLRAEIEGHFAPPAGPRAERDATLVRVLASRRLISGSFLAGTAALAVPLFLTTGLLFALFPRVGLGFLAFGATPGTHVAGFGADVSLGEVGILRDDPTVVARIVPPPAIASRTQPDLQLLLRGTSFDAYDGRRWSRTHTGGERLRRYGEEFMLTRTVDVRHDEPWHIALEHLDQPVVFLPPDAVAVDVPSRVSVGLDVGRALTLSPGLDLRYDDPDALGLHYVVWTERGRRGPEPLGEDDLRRYLALPEGDEPLASIARTWTEGATTDRQRAESIASRLNAPPFVYSRTMADPGSTPPLVYFLETSHRGHCEYYASAMAILLREVSVPTRLVTGFSGAHYNGYGAYYTVRSGDAHTWVEAYVDGEGWTTFDPTPASLEEPSTIESALIEVRALLDAIRARWAEWIVGYDLRSQRDVARAIGRWLQGGSSSTPRGLQASTPTSVPWRALATIVAILVLAVLADRAYRRLLRGRQPGARARLSSEAREIVALYRELEAELARLGVPRAPNVTPLEHATALEAARASAADVTMAVTRRYLDARFGGRIATPSELEMLRARVRSLRAIAPPR